MTENIDQVTAPEDGIVTDAIPTEENADVVQEPDAALEAGGNPDEGQVAPGEDDDSVQDVAIENSDNEVGADDDQPATP